jgi:hypothetical protein
MVASYASVPSREDVALISDQTAATPCSDDIVAAEDATPPPLKPMAQKQQDPGGTTSTSPADTIPVALREGLLTKADESVAETVQGCCGVCKLCGHCQEQADPSSCGWFAIMARLPLLHDLAFVLWFFVLAPRICPDKTAYVLVLFMTYGATRYILTYISAMGGICHLAATAHRDRAYWEGLPLAKGEETPFDQLLHVVMIMSYKEPLEKLAQTLDTLAANSMHGRLVVCLAMEDRDPRASQTASQLRERYSKDFYDVCYTVHRLAEGETPGKSSNENWAARCVVRHLQEDHPEVALDNVTITVCDADTFYHPQYFAALSYQFLRTPPSRRQRRFWQPIVSFMPNVLKVPMLCTIRYTQFSMGFAGQMYNPLGIPMPNAVYSLGLRLAIEAGYWVRRLSYSCFAWHHAPECLTASH